MLPRGSGKSSLIHAGVTPELRSFGIPGAGDFWLPMVCTPGTNVAQADQAKRLNSPLTRGELRHFVTATTIGEAEAARGQHDDCVMAAAIGLPLLIGQYHGDPAVVAAIALAATSTAIGKPS